MATKVTLEWKKPKTADKIINKYRKSIHTSLNIYMDRVRRSAADNFIIPNKTNPKTYNPYKARKQQPAMPFLLTSRTGLLKAALMERLPRDVKKAKDWSTPRGKYGRSRKKTNSLIGMVHTKNKGSEYETYEATWKVSVVKGSSLLTNPVRAKYLKGKVRGESRPHVLLAMRYRWELRGRHFMKPAAQKEKLNLSSIIKNKWGELRSL